MKPVERGVEEAGDADGRVDREARHVDAGVERLQLQHVVHRVDRKAEVTEEVRD